MSDTKTNILSRKLIAIIRGISAEYIVDTVKSLIEGGITTVEVTFDQRSDQGIENTIQCLQILEAKMKGQILMGAGTVMTEEQVNLAERYGARFIISPNVNTHIIKRTKELGMVSIPGAITPSEIAFAYDSGADIIKIFPAGVWGVDYINAIRGPLGHIPLMAVGGIEVKCIKSYFDSGIAAFGIGKNLVNVEYAKEGKFDLITKEARRFHVAINDIINAVH